MCINMQICAVQFTRILCLSFVFPCSIYKKINHLYNFDGEWKEDENQWKMTSIYTHKKSEKESFMVLVNWWLFWHKNKYKCAIDVCFSCQFFCPWQNFIFHWLWFLFVSIARIDNPCHRLQFFVCCKSHFHFAFYFAYFHSFLRYL